MRDAEIAESRRSFTLRRLNPNFRFDGATAKSLEVRFMPLPLSEKFLAQHVEGGRIEPGEGPKRLEIGGEFAVPIGAKLGARGRVPASQEPSRLLKSKRAFIAKGVLFKRTGRRGARQNIALFALVPQIELPERFKFYETARATAQRHVATKAREEFVKALARG
jgi:hypothetical protein